MAIFVIGNFALARFIPKRVLVVVAHAECLLVLTALITNIFVTLATGKDNNKILRKEKMKTIFFDVETSGTDDKKNGILQLAGELEIGDSGVKERFDYKMKPFPDQIIEDGALEANGITREQIETFADPFVCHIEFVRMLDRYVDRFDRKDKFTLVGYNSRFDDGFLREWFKRCNEKYYGSFFYWPAIDVSNMVAVKYRTRRNLFPDMKLMTVAELLGIDIDKSKAHDAVYDTAVTKALYEKCLAC